MDTAGKKHRKNFMLFGESRLPNRRKITSRVTQSRLVKLSVIPVTPKSQLHPPEGAVATEFRLVAATMAAGS